MIREANKSMEETKRYDDEEEDVLYLIRAVVGSEYTLPFNLKRAVIEKF